MCNSTNGAARFAAVLLAGPLLLAACGADEHSPAAEGELLTLAYNVAGLPEGLSGSHPKVNTPLISPKLNTYDLALVQEDFWYHTELAASTAHPHRSDPMLETPDWLEMGDGLNRFSSTPFENFERIAWEVCFGTTGDGSDCATTKGFSFARHTLAAGVTVDVYNLHMDAGGDEGSQQARQSQVEQLILAIEAHSSDRAVIVAGDTNLKQWKEDRVLDGPVLDRLLAGSGLSDSCRLVNCPEETHDRVMFRAAPDLELRATAWSRPTEFVDATGEGLSDHEPVAVVMTWRALR